MKKTILFLGLILCFSCKNETTNTKSQELQEPEPIAKVTDNIFTFSVELKTEEADILELYYVDDFPDAPFTREKRMAKSIEAGSDFQTIEFKLPKNSLPYKMRLDIGDNGNKFETPVFINSIKLTLNNNVIAIDDTLMDSFFQPNEYVTKIEGGYLRKTIENKYDPFITARPLLIKKIELEL
ncbi:hypothetical protein ACFSQP_06845 [Bizionia sediminis]|uniref:Uncharacterized protein n=1 Tax=Bizionia sediminis TaxID=1737064 RepID=A0ABW5KT33_9FLAO